MRERPIDHWTSEERERFKEALQAFIPEHAGKTLLDLANEADAMAEAESKAWFEAHPETTLENVAKSA